MTSLDFSFLGFYVTKNKNFFVQIKPKPYFFIIINGMLLITDAELSKPVLLLYLILICVRSVPIECQLDNIHSSINHTQTLGH